MKPAGSSSLLPSTPALLPQNDSTVSFDMKKGWQRSSDKTAAILHWLPFEDPDSVGLWAYVDGKVIRSNGVDSMTIFNIGDLENGNPSAESGK
jgi:hypothetical protein